jgi:hypothetical protein
MKLSTIAFSAAIASATAQNGPQRLRSRALKPEAMDEKPKGPVEAAPVEAESSMSMESSLSMDSTSASVSMSIATYEFDEVSTELEQFGFDASVSLSMSLPAEPIKCDKKCQKEQMKAEPQFAEWGAEALTPFAFDASMSFSMSLSLPSEPVKCDKRCQKDKLKSRQRRRLSEASSLSMSMSLSANFEWAEPDLTAFEFDGVDGSLSLSMSAP